MKRLFSFIAIASILISFAFSFNSGVKFGVDTDIFKVMSKFDFNHFARNKTLVNSTEVNGTMLLFDYSLKIQHLILTNITSPGSVTVNNFKKGESIATRVEINKAEVDLITDFSFKVNHIYHDSFTSIPIKVVIDKLQGEFSFDAQGMIQMSAFQVKFDKIDISFHSKLYNFIYEIGHSLIRKAVESKLATLKGMIEQAVNKFIHEQWLMDIGMGIGFNLTNVDRPKVEEFNVGFAHILLETLKTFLGEEHKKQDEINTVLTFGIHGSVYPNIHPDMKPNIKPAVNMDFIKEFMKNEISILLSDYTLNSFLFMGQQTGALRKEVTNDTNEFFPFNIDIEGVSTVIPQFKEFYNQNFLVQMKIFVPPIGYNQPLISTSGEGPKLIMNYGIEFNVFNSDDPFDDPVKALHLNVTASTKLGLMMEDNKLSVTFGKIEVEKMVKKIDVIGTKDEDLAKSIGEMSGLIIKHYSPYTENIDIVGMLHNLTGLNLGQFQIRPSNEYIAMSLDILDI